MYVLAVLQDLIKMADVVVTLKIMPESVKIDLKKLEKEKKQPGLSLALWYKQNSFKYKYKIHNGKQKINGCNYSGK